MEGEKKEKAEFQEMKDIQIKLIRRDDVLKAPIFKGDSQVNPKINSRSF
jgi:hypothetical protein